MGSKASEQGISIVRVDCTTTPTQNAKDQHMFAQVHTPSKKRSNVTVVPSVRIIRSYKTIIAILVIIQLLMTWIE